MAGLELNPAQLQTPVLPYAARQKPWERGITAILCVVCIEQVLLVVEILFVWQFYWTLGSNRVVDVFSALNIILPLVALPLASILLVVCAVFLLLRPQSSRQPLLVSAWILLAVLCCAQALSIVSIIDARGPSLLKSDHLEAEQVAHLLPRADTGMSPLLGLFSVHLQSVIANLYPLFLVILVLGGKGELRTKAIWWVTLSACAIFATPTALTWILHLQAAWSLAQVTLPPRPDWALQAVTGVGLLCSELWSVFVLGMFGYALFGGRNSRPLWLFSSTFLIACTLIIYGGVTGQAIFEKGLALPPDAWERSFRVWQWVTGIGAFLFSLAFPLAIRMALNLSAVRTRLDGMKSGPVPAVTP